MSKGSLGLIRLLAIVTIVIILIITIIIVSGGFNEEESDMNTILLLLRLRDIRARYDIQFNITAEMMRERNQNLAVTEDNTDFVVASNMSSLILAQLAESPELLPVFSELLSLEGNELYLKTALSLNCSGTRSVAQIRSVLLASGYIFIGYKSAESMVSIFNPPLSAQITLDDADSIIVIGDD